MPNPVPAVSPVQELTERFLPHLRPAQQRGLAAWVAGLLAAESGCESAVLARLETLGLPAPATRARLREVLGDGAERAAPCATRLDAEGCFAPLLAWVLRWWVGDTLPLASDATRLHDRQVVLSISVLARGSAIPVAWVVLPDQGQGHWRPHLARLLRRLGPAVPATMTVLVLTDRGVWSPRLWRPIRETGWHPLLRIRPAATCAPAGARRQRARARVPGPGCCWVGEGLASKHHPKRIAAPLVVGWGADQAEPGLLLTDLPPDRVGVGWSGLRTGIAPGFRARQSCGWDWQRTRRTDPARIARHWLVLAIATLLNLAVGTRLEDAAERGTPPGRLRRPRPPPPPRTRRVAVFARGLDWLQVLVVRGTRWWRAWWLLPERLPDPPLNLTILRHLVTPGVASA